jgi:hypothetical protein
MKKYLLVGFIIAVAGLCSAQAQSSISAPVNGPRQVPKQRPAPNISTGKAVGAFPRAARGGNPLQLINPRAPQQYYGRVEDTVVQGDRPTPTNNKGESVNRFAGVVLFGIAW